MSASEDLVRAALNRHLEKRPYGFLEAFCEEVGIPTHSMRRYRKPGVSMPMEVIDQVAKALGYGSPWELLKPAEAPAKAPPKESAPQLTSIDSRAALLGEIVQLLADEPELEPIRASLRLKAEKRAKAKDLVRKDG